MVKISWRTTSDMSKPQFDKPTRAELHHGRGQQRRQARSLVRPAQHPALREHAAHPRRPRLSARRRHAHGTFRRPPAGLAGLPAADQLRGACRAQDLVDAFATYEFCELPEQPAFDLVPGPAASWKAIWPSLAVVGEPFRLAIVAEDMWGNPTADADHNLKLVPSRPVRGLPAQRCDQERRRAARVRKSRRRGGPGDIDLALVANGQRSRARQSAARGHGERHCAATGAICTARAGKPSASVSAENYFRYARDRPSSTSSATKATTSRSPMRSGTSSTG